MASSAKLPAWPMRERFEYVRGWLPAPPMVLLPGLFAGAWIWKPAWDRLRALGYSVLQLVEPYAAIDAIDATQASIDRLRQMLIGVLDEQEIFRAILCAANMLRYVVATRNYDVRKCLPEIQCDVLMIWGEHDRIAPVEDWERNLHLLARASLHKLASCGHSPTIEKPAEFNAILTKFMLEREGAGQPS